MTLVFMFQPRFAPLVESGAKRQTVRPLRKRSVSPGMRLSLRQWTAAPYRSKHRILREAVCSEVRTVCIIPEFGEIHVDGCLLMEAEAIDFAHRDGFTGLREMMAWFRETHGEGVFSGILVCWHQDHREVAEEKRRAA